MRTVDAAGLTIGEGVPTRIMGVVNVSDRSPYHPSVHTEADAAATYIDEQVSQGADIVDIGLSTANKRFEPLTVEEELDRLDVAAEAIASASKTNVVFSIETRYHEVAAKALDRGFDMVNDICGFADPDMPKVCADHDVAVVKMASPPDLRRPGAIDTVDEIHQALTRGGFTERTILDPAFGGWSPTKSLAVDRETFDRLEEFRAYGRPILVSINRKNFLRELADRSTEEALPVSLAATSLAIERGASVIRTHDVAPTRDAAIIGDELGDSRLRMLGDIEVFELDTESRGALRVQLSELGLDTARADDWSWRVFAVHGSLDDRPWVRERLTQCGLQVSDGEYLIIAGSTRNLLRTQGIVDQLPADAAKIIRAILDDIR